MILNEKIHIIKVRDNDFILNYSNDAINDIENNEFNILEINELIKNKLETSKYYLIDISKDLNIGRRFCLKIKKEQKIFSLYAIFKQEEKKNKLIKDKENIFIKEAYSFGIFLEIEVITELKIKEM